MLKRAFDIAAVCSALVILGIPLLLVALVLRFTGEHEVFYRQERIGRNGKPFFILKFATMLKNSPNLTGGDITVTGDPRVLPVGKFLRKTKINELPQLFNVLFGDMSLIGYRPLTPRIADMFPAEHWVKLSGMRPGLSGIGSIVFRDEERLLTFAQDRQRFYAEEIMPYKAALEWWYVRHNSFWVDLKLVTLTIVAVLNPATDIRRYFSDLPEAPSTLIMLRSRSV